MYMYVCIYIYIHIKAFRAPSQQGAEQHSAAGSRGRGSHGRSLLPLCNYYINTYNCITVLCTC